MTYGVSYINLLNDIPSSANDVYNLFRTTQKSKLRFLASSRHPQCVENPFGVERRQTRRRREERDPPCVDTIAPRDCERRKCTYHIPAMRRTFTTRERVASSSDSSAAFENIAEPRALNQRSNVEKDDRRKRRATNEKALEREKR